MSYEHPYHGLKVLEVAQGFAGPCCRRCARCWRNCSANVPPPNGSSAFNAADALCNPISDFGDWLSDPHVQETGRRRSSSSPASGPLPMPTVPGTAAHDAAGRPPVAPSAGEHGRTILAELGLGDSKIADLAREGITRLPDWC